MLEELEIGWNIMKQKEITAANSGYKKWREKC